MSVSPIEKQDQGELSRAEQTRARRTFRPSVDIIEQNEELMVVADMPGARPDDIDIQFEKGTLTIYGKVSDRQPEDTNYLSREYAVGDFWRTFQVSEAIDPSAISADFANGVLMLHLPKTAQAKPRKISVKSG
jgi:HSP20 family molecular chaperone IbpA